MDVRGEAVAVDLPNGKTLFALLSAPTYNGEAEHVAFNVFLREITMDRGFSDSCGHLNYTVKALATGNYRAEVPEDMYPTMVWLDDFADPTSVTPVAKETIETSFGADYRIRQILIETTDADVTWETNGRLSWLEEQRGSLIKRPVGVAIGDMPEGSRITEADFAEGERK
ncbi:MAG: hypothetical protein WA906_13435 [Pacificimonas sp.]